MRKPTAETSQFVRLHAAALAIRTNCRKHSTKDGRCTACVFWEKNREPHCRLNMTPPSEWKFEEDENNENSQS